MSRVSILMRPHDPEQVYLEMQVDGLPVGHMFLTASELETHIRQTAQQREQLSDQVSKVLDPGARLETVVDPVWRTAEHPDGIVLALRHPGLGWLSFLLPRDEAQGLGSWLADHSKQPEAK